MIKKSCYSAAILCCKGLIIFLYFTSTGFAGEGNNIIISFGDSITQGLWEILYTPNGERVGGFQPELEKLTDSSGNHFDVLNYGLGGETTLEGIQRLPQILNNTPGSQYVIILEGTNDIWSGISRATTVMNLGFMIENIKKYNIAPIIGTFTPDTRPGISEFKNIPAYNSLIRELADDKKVSIVDFYSEMIDQWNTLYADGQDRHNGKGPDYLHPSSAGYRKMAELWFKNIFHRPQTTESVSLLLLKQ